MQPANRKFNKTTLPSFQPVVAGYHTANRLPTAPYRPVERTQLKFTPDGRPSSQLATPNIDGRIAQKAENAHLAAGTNARHFGVSPFRR